MNKYYPKNEDIDWSIFNSYGVIQLLNRPSAESSEQNLRNTETKDIQYIIHSDFFPEQYLFYKVHSIKQTGEAGFGDVFNLAFAPSASEPEEHKRATDLLNASHAILGEAYNPSEPRGERADNRHFRAIPRPYKPGEVINLHRVNVNYNEEGNPILTWGAPDPLDKEFIPIKNEKNLLTHPNLGQEIPSEEYERIVEGAGGPQNLSRDSKKNGGIRKIYLAEDPSTAHMGWYDADTPYDKSLEPASPDEVARYVSLKALESKMTQKNALKNHVIDFFKNKKFKYKKEQTLAIKWNTCRGYCTKRCSRESACALS